MTYTYNPFDDVGRVRRTIPDNDLTDAFFTDEDIQSMINDEGDWRRASALGLETIAADSAMVLQVVFIEGIRTNGASAAKALLDRAALLRDQALIDEVNQGGGFEIIETVPDNFALRKRLRNEALRTNF